MNNADVSCEQLLVICVASPLCYMFTTAQSPVVVVPILNSFYYI